MARPAQDRAEAILDAARAQLRQDGAERTTVGAVAARAGVGKGTVFLYWPTKSRLIDAVLSLEAARLMADLAEDLRTGAAELSVGRVIRREIAAVLENADLAPQIVDPPGATGDPDEFPRQALRRIVSVMRTHGLIREVPTEEVVVGIKTVMAGALAIGTAEPDRVALLLDAAERMIAATYDRPDADPADAAAALPHVVEVLEDTIDQLVGAAAPERPTAAILRPRERPGR